MEGSLTDWRLTVWVTQRQANTVTKIRAIDSANLGTFPVGRQPEGVAFDGANIWVANYTDGTVTKLLASDGSNLGTFNVGSLPTSVIFDGTNIWVLNQGNSTVTKIRPSDGAILNTFPAGPSAFDLTYDGANIWTISPTWYDSIVTKLRASDGVVLGTFSLAPNEYPRSIVFDGANIWVANFMSNTLTKMSFSGAILGTFPAGPLPSNVAYNGFNQTYPMRVAFDGTNIWVTDDGWNGYQEAASGNVLKIRPSDAAILGSFSVGSGPEGVVSDGSTVWVANGASNSITKVNDTMAVDVQLPPTIFDMQPRKGPVGTRLTITGINFGQSPGAVSYNYDNVAVESWSDTRITMFIQPTWYNIPDISVVTASNLASGTDFFTITPPPTSLTLTPSTATLLVGSDRTFALIDHEGNQFGGATWTTNNSAVISLSSDDPPLITALNPGMAIVTASLTGQSAQATIDVVAPGPNGGFPPGTVRWSVTPAIGFQAKEILQVFSTDFSRPDLVAVERDNNNNDIILRGLTSDGQQMWQSAAQRASTFMPDAAGGILGAGASLVHYDGLTGASDWQYTPPTPSSLPGSIPGNSLAVRADNVVFGVETTYLGGSTFQSRLLGIQNGAIAYQHILPTFHATLHNDQDFCNDISTEDMPPWVGPPAIGSDGAIYIIIAYGTSTGGYDCAGHYALNDTVTLSLLKADISGNTTMQTLHTYSGQAVQFDAEQNQPREVIPDGSGGMLAAWDHIEYDAPGHVSAISARITDVDASGGAADFTLPLASWCGEGDHADPNPNNNSSGCFFLSGGSNFSSGSLLLGENNTAFASNGDKLVAFNVSSGGSQWSWLPPPSNSIALLASTAGGGVVAKIIDQNKNENVFRFNAMGAETQDPVSGTGLEYYAQNIWPAVTGGVAAAYDISRIDNADPPLWSDVNSLWGRRVDGVQVLTFSQSGPEEADIHDALQGIVDALALPNYSGCANWLKGTTMTGTQYIQFLFTPNGFGASSWFGHGDFGVTSNTDAFTGSEPAVGPGILLTVNERGGFFKSTTFFGGTIEEGPKKYQGGSLRAKDLILIHEVAHGVEASGFQSDLGKPTVVKENNKLVDTNCRRLIERH